MTKQWLIRRSVRMPVSRATTAPISSSVCRLPFISAAALPSRTRATALAAESWLCADSTIGRSAMSMPMPRRHVANARRRPDQDRLDQAQPACLHRAPERDFVTRMRNRGDDRRQLLRRVDQTQILVVRPWADVRKVRIHTVHALCRLWHRWLRRIDLDQVRCSSLLHERPTVLLVPPSRQSWNGSRISRIAGSISSAPIAEVLATDPGNVPRSPTRRLRRPDAS